MPRWWVGPHGAGRPLGLVYLAISAVIAWVLIDKAGERAWLGDAQTQARIRVVEGSVTSFRPMPAGGHALERFCVDGQCFEYSDWQLQRGFNTSVARGGPIREGLPVRITHVDGAILKLEIRR